MASNETNETLASDEWRMTVHTTLTVLAVIIIIVNVPVVVLYFKISSLRHSAGNTFLVGLALADILCACVMIPTIITCQLRLFENDHLRNVCISYYASTFILSVGSIYHIVAATAAKYLAIVYPMRNITACTKTRVNSIVAFIWVGSFLVGHVPFYLVHMSGDQQQEMMHNYSLFLIVFAFAIPTLILTCIHVHIYLRLLLNSRSRALINEVNTRSENNRRIAFLFFLLFLFFFISWLPWYLSWAEIIPDGELTEGLSLLRFLAPVLNPFIFTFAKRDFRKAAMSLVNRLRGRQREFSSRRHHTQATSSVDRTNFIEQPKTETTSKAEPEEPEDAGNDDGELEMM